MESNVSRSFTLHRKTDGRYEKLETEIKAWINETFNEQIIDESTPLHQKLRDGQLLCEYYYLSDPL